MTTIKLKKVVSYMVMVTCLSIPATLLAQTHVPLFVGTYTQPGKSEGIYVYNFNQKTGGAELITSIKTNNPSYLAKRSDGRVIYAVNEMHDGTESLSAFAFDGKQLRLLNSMPTGGADPCHVALSERDPIAVVSNYSGGSFTLYKLHKDGSIASQEAFVQHSGSGVDKARQEKPHVHSAFFSNDFSALYVQDLGTDKITIYPIQSKDGHYQLGEPSVVSTPAGGGPRHITLSRDGKYLYVVLEMTAKVVVYQKEADNWKQLQEITINRTGFQGKDGAADIKLSPDGHFLYASNRVDANVISAYQVKADGTLVLLDTYDVKGKGPRNFNFSPNGKLLLVANQLTDNVTVFQRDTKSGKLKDVLSTLNVFSPVCIVF
ncbi:lactonase family protein [Sphingobacterium sp. SYP-B4668]|uniref:lactonase family protein n=1 Tax=Sphingobacterium sp. SYP-B4668 TaxID=2996035 RepID=UPI0022DDE433|nr:lactonase family protein [Sphingobacterium sp. SYP-B4668]